MSSLARVSGVGSGVKRDVLVIGAGFGGLGAALALAERGARVTVCEALTYPGGCASTFTRKGVRYEAGATLFSGLGPSQLFGDWITRFELPVTVDWIDPVVETRAPGLSLPVDRDRAAFVERLCAMPGAPVGQLRRFFAEQSAYADTLWELFDQPALLPPLSFGSLLQHVGRVPRYAPLLPLLLRPLSSLAGRHGLGEFEPFQTWLRGVCQITVQCTPDEAEAAFAVAAMDYCWRGTGHIRGGIGSLAGGLVTAIGRSGGEVRLANRVSALRQDGRSWVAETREGPLVADAVVANLLPGDLARLLGGHKALEARQKPVAEGWGAVMLYRVVRGGDGPAHHLDLTLDRGAPPVDGNHVFVSVASTEDDRGVPPGHRVLTASTHVSLARLRTGDPASIVARIQQHMRDTIGVLAPEVTDVVSEMTASPRTFHRFVRRAEGAVGGVPRRAGLAAWSQLGPVSPERGLWLVGDSVFPGQSTYAASLGGVRVAEAISRDSGY